MALYPAEIPPLLRPPIPQVLPPKYQVLFNPELAILSRNKARCVSHDPKNSKCSRHIAEAWHKMASVTEEAV